MVHGPRSGPQDVVPPEGGLRQLVTLTQYVVRGTRSVAQDIVCPRRGLRRYVTLTQDIVAPEGGATYCHVLDVVCFTVTGPRPMDPRRGATISRIDILNVL